MITLLQAAGAAKAAGAATGAAAQQPGGGAGTWILLILIFLVMWLFMIRPQRKQQKEIEAMRAALQKGDKVVTAGGIKGVIAEVTEKDILIKIDGEVKIRVDKSCVNKDTSDAQAQQK